MKEQLNVTDAIQKYLIMLVPLSVHCGSYSDLKSAIVAIARSSFSQIEGYHPCNEDPLTFHFYIVKLGFTGVYIIF